MTIHAENLPDNNPETVDYPPSIYDLEENSEISTSRRLFRRYITTGNYDRSIKMYELVGMPLFRKLIMRTMGNQKRKSNPYSSNYFLDKRKSKLEAATDFAYDGSVYNETLHGVGALVAGALGTSEFLFQGMGAETGVYTASVATNLALVGLQRYNRARMLRTIDEELGKGEHYSPDYRNKFGIDALAEDNYYAD